MMRLQGPDHDFPAGVVQLQVSPLQQLFAAIEQAAASPLARRHHAVAAALQPYLGMVDLLCGMTCPASSAHYVRHLLHAASDHTVLALVWRPGQMSPVHGHRSWCALGIHRGFMTETSFVPGHQGPVSRGCVQRSVGDISHAPADPDAIHRLANLGTETAVSIHVYGARYDRLSEQVNHVWAS